MSVKNLFICGVLLLIVSVAGVVLVITGQAQHLMNTVSFFNSSATIFWIAIGIGAVLVYPAWKLYSYLQFRGRFTHNPNGDEDERMLIQGNVNFEIAGDFKTHQNAIDERDAFTSQFKPTDARSYSETVRHLEMLAQYRQKVDATLRTAQRSMRIARRQKYQTFLHEDYLKMRPVEA